MKLSRISIFYRSLQSFGGVLFFLILFGGASLGDGLLAVFLILFFTMFFGLLSLFWQYVIWRNYEYYLENDSLEIEQGVFSRKRREIPWKRVQNVDISRSFFQRILGIAKVNFETAGGGGTEASLRYVRYENAKEIQEKVRKLKKQVETDEEEIEEEDSELFFELELRELVLLSFFSVNIGIVFTVFVIVSVIGSADIFSNAGALVISTLAVAVLIFVWISRAASTFATFFDFKLYRSDDALEYEHGLLNRSSGSIPLDKIQSIKLEENPLKRWFGYTTVKIETAGYSPSAALEKGSEVAIPLTTRNKAIDFARRIRDFEPLDYTRVPKRAKRRYVGRYAIVLSVLFAAGFTANELFTDLPYWILLALMPFIPVAAHYKWKNRGYQVGENNFFTINGYWNRVTVIVPYYRMQNLIESQTILQRRWSLATLTFDTAGTSILSKGIKLVDGGKREVEEVREEVYGKFRGSL